MDDDFEEGTLVKKMAPSRPAVAGSGVACLIQLYPAGPDLGRRQALEAAEYVLGRVADADLVIDRESVSRRHARLTKIQGSWVVTDLGSTNGTFVNDVRVDSERLRDGDQLRIGDMPARAKRRATGSRRSARSTTSR